MKLTTTLAGLVILAALGAFLVTPVLAEDEAPAPRPPAPAGAPPPQGLRLAPLALAADADRDGTVSAAEWKAFLANLQKAFETLDANADGALTREELPRPPHGLRAGPPRGPRVGPPMRPPNGARGPDGARGPRAGADRRDGPAGPPPMDGRSHPAPDGLRDLGARLDRLTSALEKLLERMESRPPR